MITKNGTRIETCLIVEGGGFKTGFTSGILDAFITSNFDPFSNYIGVSGGSVAVSYFLSRQYRSCLNAMLILARDGKFMDYKRAFTDTGYMDIDFIKDVASKEEPFIIQKAISNSENKNINFVATNRKTGNPVYLKPNVKNWFDCVVASCTLPFVTKGMHKINDAEYFDGGWSDALPTKWAYENGAKRIIILRTSPSAQRFTQKWTDYFGSIYFKSHPRLGEVFKYCNERYNASIDYIENPPSDLEIYEIAPAYFLKSKTLNYSKQTIMKDYRYGVDLGLQFVNTNKCNFEGSLQN